MTNIDKNQGKYPWKILKSDKNWVKTKVVVPLENPKNGQNWKKNPDIQKYD